MNSVLCTTKSLSSERTSFRALFALSMLCSIASTTLNAQQPTGGSIVAGVGTISTGPGSTTITAGNNSVFKWDSFNVGAGESVRFIQPGSDARVMNWIGGLTPSQINGSLSANGQVYLLNPAGVYFGQSAVVDVGRLYAIGGSLSKEDFLAGLNRFTGLTGEVRNDGSLRGSAVALVGRTVVNTGTIVSPDGFIALAAGEQVLLGRDGSRIYVDAGSRSTLGLQDTDRTPGVSNSGAVDAGRGSVLLAAGDMYSVAITQDGQLMGRDIQLQGQGRGNVLVSGSINASSTEPGVIGGQIEVTGERVALLSGTVVDASGSAGGGTVLVGGDYQGANSAIRNSTATTIMPGVTIRADAIVKGDGGEVIVWSNDSTRFFGAISAKGGFKGGQGGLVETSGRRYLAAFGSVDASAPVGAPGSWLLDPHNVTIDDNVNAGGDFDGNPSVFTPDANNAIADRNAIQTSLNGGTSVEVNTGSTGTDELGDIIVAASITKNTGGNATLTLSAANNISVSADITASVGLLGIVLIADADESGAGQITVNNQLNSNGGVITLTAATDITLAGANADITTGGGVLTITADGDSNNSGSFNQNNGGSAISVGAGSVAIAGRDVSISGTITSVGAAAVNFGGTTGGSFTLTGNITATGGFTATGGNGPDIFAINNGSNASLNGGAGDDRFSFNGGTVTTASGGDGTDTFTLNGGTVITISGGTNSDTLEGTPAADEFTINANNGGSVTGGPAFTEIETVSGRGGNDTFNVNAAGSITTLNGGDGNDTFNFTGGTVIAANGDNDNDIFNLGLGSVTAVAGGNGGTNSDTLNGAGNTTLTGNNAGAAAGATNFTEVEVLNSGGTNTLTGTTGADIFVVNAVNGGTVANLTFSGYSTLNGDAGNDRFTFDTGGAITTLNGGANSDTLEGTPAADEFTINAGNGGIVTGGPAFSEIETVSGRGGNDTFNVNAGGSIGTLNGDNDNDIFNLNGGAVTTVAGGNGGTNSDTLNGAGNTTLSGNNAGTTAGGASFAGIEALNSGGTFNLTGTGLADTFVIDGTNGGTVASVRFSGYGTLDGAGGNDVFTVTSTGSISNQIDGGVGESTFSINGTVPYIYGRSDQDRFTFNTGAVVTGVYAGGGNDTFTFNGGSVGSADGDDGDDLFVLNGGTVTTIIGGLMVEGERDELQGRNDAADEFTINAGNGGIVTGGPAFTEIETVSGRGGNDTFNVNAGGSIGTLNGDNDNDIFNLNGGAVTTVAGGNGGTNSDTLNGAGNTTLSGNNAGTTAGGASFAGIEALNSGGTFNLTGTGLADTFVIDGTNGGTVASVRFSGYGTLDGAGGNDVFTVTSTGSISNQIDGGVGESTFSINGTVPYIYGRSDQDSFTFNTGAVVTGVYAGGGNDTFTFNGGSVGSADGDDGDDLFVLNGGTVTTIIGGLMVEGERDELQGRNDAADEFTINANSGGTVTGGPAFSEIETVSGRGGNDTFNVNAGGSIGTLNGDNDNDIFNLNGGAVTTVAGGNGGTNSDTLNGAGNTTLSGNNAGTTAGGASFAGIEALNSGGTFNLTGTGLADTFVIDGTNGGTVASVRFSGYGTLDGAGGNDVFTVTSTGSISNQIDGGVGESTFSINGTVPYIYGRSDQDSFTFNTGAVVTGVYAGGGNDTFTFNGGSVGSADGDDGDDLFVLNGGTVTTIIGGLMVEGERDELQGRNDAADEFTINANSGGTVTGGPAFSEIETVSGRGGNDTFNVNAGGSIGTLNGDNDNDIFNLNGGTVTTINGDIGADTLSGTGDAILIGNNTGTAAGATFTGIDVLDSGGVYSLTGTVGNDEFVVNAANGGTVANLTFLGYSTLNGVGGDDSFTINAGSIAAFNGGVGNDTFTFTGGSVTLANGDDDDNIFNLGAGTVTTISGGNGTDTLNGAGDTTLSGNNAGTTTGGTAFTRVEFLNSVGPSALTGTGGQDFFVVNTVNGGTVANLTFSGYSTLDGAAGDDSFAINFGSIAILNGGAGKDTFTFNGGAVTGANGGDDDDKFTLNGGAVNTVAGGNLGSNNDTLEGTTGADTFTISVANGGTVIDGPNFSGIETILGRSGADVFTLNLGGSVVTLNGDEGNDTFNLGAGLVTTVAGGNGSDALNGAGDTTLSANNAGVTAGGTGFTGIEFLHSGGTNALTGTGEPDAFVIDAINRGTVANLTFTGYNTLNGAVGDDSLTIPNVAFAAGMTFNGGAASNDTVAITDASAIGSVIYAHNNGADGTITFRAAPFTYTGIESISDNLSATDRIFTYTGGDKAITLLDGLNTGFTAINSTLGATISFRNPTTSLTINAGDGHDTFGIAGIDAGFGAALGINGDDGRLDISGIEGLPEELGLTITALGSVTNSGAITVPGAFAISNSGVGASITLGETTTANFGTLNFVSEGAVFIKESSAAVLAGMNTADSLTLTAAGTITDLSDARLIVLGQANFDAGINAITLGDDAANITHFGTLGVTGDRVTITEDSSMEVANATAGTLILSSVGEMKLGVAPGNFIVGTSTVPGDLNVTAGGDVTQGTSVTVTGQTTIQTGEGNVLLNNTNNDFTTLSVDAHNVAIHDVNTVELRGVRASGSFAAVTGGALNVGTEIQSTTDLELTSASSDITLNASVRSTGGNVALKAQGAVVQNAGQLSTNGGTISIGAGSAQLGGISSSGGSVIVSTLGSTRFMSALSISGPFSVSAGASGATFDQGIDGVDPTSDLTVNTIGTTRFSAAVGAGRGLHSLTTDLGGTTVLAGGSVRADIITFGDGIVIENNTTVTASTANFKSTIEGDTDGGRSLVLNVSVDTTLAGAVGAAGHRLASLTTDAPGRTLISGGAISTSGSQTYGDEMGLGSATTFTASALTFDKIVNTVTTAAPVSASDLTAEVSGVTLFKSAVGQTGRLGIVTTQSGGSTTVQADIAATEVAFGNAVTFDGATATKVDTTGKQVYGGTVTLGTDLVLSSSIESATEGIQLKESVSGAGRALSLTAAKGGLIADKDLGSEGGRLDSVTATGRNIIIGGDIFTEKNVALDIGVGNTEAENDFLRFDNDSAVARSTRIDSATGEIILGSGAAGSPEKTDAPLRSSIFKSNDGDLYLFARRIEVQPFERTAVRSGSLVAIADGTASGDGITLGNTAASDYLVLATSNPSEAGITFLSRAPADVFSIQSETVAKDNGTDLIAGAVLFFSSRFGGSMPTRTNFVPSTSPGPGQFDYDINKGNIPAFAGELAIAIQPAGATHNVYVADLLTTNTFRPLRAHLAYLDLSTAPGFATFRDGFIGSSAFPEFAPNESQLRSLVSIGAQVRNSLEQAFTPDVPRQQRDSAPAEPNFSSAVREQLQALGIYARALKREERISRQRRAGLFVEVPATDRPQLSDYEVVDARVEDRAVRDVIRSATEAGLLGAGQDRLDEVARSLAGTFETYAAGSDASDPRAFRKWLEGQSTEDAKRVLGFVASLRSTLEKIELLGLTQQEVTGSKAQIYGNVLRPRLNVEPEFLRSLVEDLPSTNPTVVLRENERSGSFVSSPASF